MNNCAIPYNYTQKGRSLSTILVTGLCAILAFSFLIIPYPIPKLIGAFLVVFVFSGFYAFSKGEVWSMSVEDGILSWSYARWPKSSGNIDSSTVCYLLVDDCSSNLSITFLDGSSRKIKLIGHARRFRDYAVSHFPHITVAFVEGT